MHGNSVCAIMAEATKELLNTFTPIEEIKKDNFSTSFNKPCNEIYISTHFVHLLHV